MPFPNVRMACQNIYSDQEMWKKNLLVLSVAIYSGIARAPMLCIPGDWCIALQFQKDLPSPSAHMKTILKFIFIHFQNAFVPRILHEQQGVFFVSFGFGRA